jgi:hypothetical protein
MRMLGNGPGGGLAVLCGLAAALALPAAANATSASFDNPAAQLRESDALNVTLGGVADDGQTLASAFASTTARGDCAPDEGTMRLRGGDKLALELSPDPPSGELYDPRGTPVGPGAFTTAFSHTEHTYSNQLWSLVDQLAKGRARPTELVLCGYLTRSDYREGQYEGSTAEASTRTAIRLLPAPFTADVLKTALGYGAINYGLDEIRNYQVRAYASVSGKLRRYRARSFLSGVRFLRPGKATISVVDDKSGLLIASRTTSSTVVGGKVRAIKVTASGRKLMKGATSARVTIKETFDPAGRGKPITVRFVTNLHR